MYGSRRTEYAMMSSHTGFTRGLMNQNIRPSVNGPTPKLPT